MIVVAAKSAIPSMDGLPTAHPTRTDAVSPDFERLKSPFDVIPVRGVYLLFQPQSSRSGLIIVDISEKHSVLKILFIDELMQKCRRRADLAAIEYVDSEQDFDSIAEEVCELDRQFSLQPPRFSNSFS